MVVFNKTGIVEADGDVIGANIVSGTQDFSGWTQNEDDYGYVGNTFGFIEDGDLMRMYDEHIETAEFIEY